MRKAFEDTGKWMIFWNTLDSAWTVTPPLGTDAELWEKSFHSYSKACEYFAKLPEGIVSSEK